MLIIGSAQALHIMISITRMKVLAVLLGPSGVGLVGIYNSLLSTVQQTAGLGMGSSGVREVASSRGEEPTLSRVRRVLFMAHLVQGTLAMLIVWLARVQISTWLFGDATLATEVGLIGVAILFALLGSAQTAVLQGMSRITDLGRVKVIGALVGTAAGLAAVLGYGVSGLIWLILLQPLAAVLVALRYTRRLPRTTVTRLSWLETWDAWKPMAKLGAGFMLGGLATAATLLVVRGWISQELGLDVAGYFTAAWVITMTYVGVLLGAMGADYYPRLTRVIDDRPAAVQLMNDQAQLSLSIGGPVLLMLIGLAPWVTTLLYSAEFDPAVALLQWQTVGNVFKLATWAMSYSIVAARKSGYYILAQLSFNLIFLSLVWWLLPVAGLLMTAIAFVIGHVVCFFVVFLFAKRLTGFRWEALSLGLLGLHVGLAATLLALALTVPLAATLASPVLAAATGLFGLRVVLIKIGPEERVAARLARIYAAIGWPIKSVV